MVNRNKQRGTAFETASVHVFREHGHTDCERRALAGSLDKGDIIGVPDCTVECKDAAKYELGPWMDETERERLNAVTKYGMLVVKRRGKNASQAFAIFPLEQAAELLRASKEV